MAQTTKLPWDINPRYLDIGKSAFYHDLVIYPRSDISVCTVQDPSSVSEVPYILFVLQAEEFCDLIGSGSFLGHVLEVQSHYPTFTICYVTNRLMNYINMWLVSQSLN
jgi:crossover junction endonuclease EME1